MNVILTPTHDDSENKQNVWKAEIDVSYSATNAHEDLEIARETFDDDTV